MPPRETQPGLLRQVFGVVHVMRQRQGKPKACLKQFSRIPNRLIL
jgi:hypothetical protein